MEEKTLSNSEIARLWTVMMPVPLPPKLPPMMALRAMEMENPNRLSFEVGRLREPGRYLDLSPSVAQGAAAG